ncbi:SRPBCC domain-containing protein [Leptospira sp. WS92.C1]
MSEQNFTTTPEFTISRILNAPRDLVWKAWTEPERLAEWWGPKGLTIGTAKVDLRPGGIFHYSMISPDGVEMWGRFVYREIFPPEKLVFVVSFSDANAGAIRHPMAVNWPVEILNVLTLTEERGKTVLKLQGSPIHASAKEIKTFGDNFGSMEEGFGGTFEKLEAYLAKQ